MTTGKTECQHHWIIPSAQGGVPSEGTCKRCGGSRLFTNSVAQKIKLVDGGCSAKDVTKAQRDIGERLQRAVELMVLS